MSLPADLVPALEDPTEDRRPPERPAGARLVPVRQLWRRLTSMRTALVLLFLLAVAAVPGSYFPQRGLNPGAVAAEFRENPGKARVLDALGLYDVFASWWFAAIYLLLFVSLVGCLVPRIRVHARALRRRPPAPPRSLLRLPAARVVSTSAPPDVVLDRAQAVLRRRRWRVERRTPDSAPASVAAEKGYARETGNLVFHVALVALLLGIAVGASFGYQGTALVVEGDTFTNTPIAYDEFSPGRLFDVRAMTPFSVRVDDFTATYLPNGQPEDFRARVRWRPDLDATERGKLLRVNHPLTVGRNRVYLLSHGYALRFTVTAKDGTKLYDQWTPFLPQDPSLLSVGVVKVPDVAPGFPQIGVRGVFLPTFGITEEGVVYSRFPDAQLPVFSFEAWAGDLGLSSGVPQNVYQLETGEMTLTGRGALLPGQSYTHLAGGATIRFEGVRDFAVLQITRDPAKEAVLIAAVAAMLGLVLSLAVRRRRFWVRVEPSGAGTLVTFAGLARQDSEGYGDEFADVVGAVTRDLPDVAEVAEVADASVDPEE